MAFGPDHVLRQIGLPFSRLAVVTFGGAYAVLAKMAQPAVSGFGWLSPSEMADGLGLAETPPDPLIMVMQCIGLIGAWRHPGCLSPLAISLLSAGLTTWVTFAPCFLWICTCAPMVERWKRAERLSGALAAITDAIGDLVANLARWLALYVLFRSVSVAGLPVFSGVDWQAAVIAASAGILLFPLKRSIMPTLARSAATGLAFSAF